MFLRNSTSEQRKFTKLAFRRADTRLTLLYNAVGKIERNDRTKVSGFLLLDAVDKAALSIIQVVPHFHRLENQLLLLIGDCDCYCDPHNPQYLPSISEATDHHTHVTCNTTK